MNSVASKAKLIGLDWGTSSLRAYLIGAQGAVLDTCHAPEGIMQMQDGKHEATLVRLLEPWLQVEKLPVIASGMITSRNGWVETPYLPLPVSANHLAQALTAFSTSSKLDLHFITGLSTDRNGAPDVMRGEETQIIGAIESGLNDADIVLPGTHSKWVSVRGGRIHSFTTFMSGEIFAALRQHTILGKLMNDAEFNEQGFIRGVTDGFDAGSQLLHRLFHVRTLPLFELMRAEEVSDYLSGMLIGAEIHGAMDKGLGSGQITIVGSHSLSDRYAIALQTLSKNISVSNDDIVALGHFSIAKSANIVS